MRIKSKLHPLHYLLLFLYSGSNILDIWGRKGRQGRYGGPSGGRGMVNAERFWLGSKSWCNSHHPIIHFGNKVVVIGYTNGKLGACGNIGDFKIQLFGNGI